MFMKAPMIGESVPPAPPPNPHVPTDGDRTRQLKKHQRRYEPFADVALSFPPSGSFPLEELTKLGILGEREEEEEGESMSKMRKTWEL